MEILRGIFGGSLKILKNQKRKFSICSVVFVTLIMSLDKRTCTNGFLGFEFVMMSFNRKMWNAIPTAESSEITDQRCWLFFKFFPYKQKDDFWKTFDSGKIYQNLDYRIGTWACREVTWLSFRCDSECVFLVWVLWWNVTFVISM